MIKHLWKSVGKSVCGLDNLQSQQLRKKFQKVNCADCINIIKEKAINSTKTEQINETSIQEVDKAFDHRILTYDNNKSREIVRKMIAIANEYNQVEDQDIEWQIDEVMKQIKENNQNVVNEEKLKRLMLIAPLYEKLNLFNEEGPTIKLQELSIMLRDFGLNGYNTPDISKMTSEKLEELLKFLLEID